MSAAERMTQWPDEFEVVPPKPKPPRVPRQVPSTEEPPPAP